MASEQEEAEVPEGGGSVADERIRLYLERHPELFNLAGEIDFHDDYVGDCWPHRGYALARTDVEVLLGEIEEQTAEIAELREAYNTMTSEKAGLLKYKEQAEQLANIVQSMRLNGARHHFAFGHQRWVDGTGYVDHCRECGKDKGHPAHFLSDAKYLDSRVVEKAAEEALRRVEDFLKSAHIVQPPAVARELLQAVLAVLPSIEGAG